MKSTRTITTAVALACCLLGAADASALGIRHSDYAIDVTGIAVTDWHYESDAYPKLEEPWTKGTGTHTLGFSTRTPLRFRATRVVGRLPPEARGTPSFALQQLTPLRPFRGSYTRTHRWEDHEPPEVCEGGPRYCPGGDADLVKPVYLCRRVAEPLPVRLEQAGRYLRVRIDPARRPFENCPPDHGAGDTQMHASEPYAVLVPKAIERIARLAPHGRTTIKAQTEHGHTDRDGDRDGCPPLSGKGMQECTVTDVTIEVRRLR